MTSRAIPPNLETEVLARAGEGLGIRQIAAWLKAERGVETSPASVHRLLTRVAAERKPIAEAVVREKLSQTLTSDLDGLTTLLARSQEIAHRLAELLEGAAPDQLLRIVAEHRRERIEQRELHVRRLTLSGTVGVADPEPDRAALEASILRAIEAIEAEEAA